MSTTAWNCVFVAATTFLFILFLGIGLASRMALAESLTEDIICAYRQIDKKELLNEASTAMREYNNRIELVFRILLGALCAVAWIRLFADWRRDRPPTTESSRDC